MGRGLTVVMLVFAGCGRIDFAPLDDARGYDAGESDASVDAPFCASPYMMVSGSCYRVDPTPQPWLTAEQQCEAENAHLINVADIAEHFVLHTMLGDAGLTLSWVGYTDRRSENAFLWVTPGGVDPAINTCFLGGISNTAANDCVTQTGTNGCPDWNIVDCATAVPFVCERDAFAADPMTY